MKHDLLEIFTRDLNKLKAEILAYKNAENIWVKDKDIANPAGNLCLHLIGNLNAYIGVNLAGTDYVRQRPLEFSATGIPREILVAQIEATIEVVEKGLNNLTDEDLNGNFPIVIWEKPTSMTYTLIHLASHLNYHLGQINYHRRLLDV